MTAPTELADELRAAAAAIRSSMAQDADELREKIDAALQLAGARRCGVYADHVDHIDPRLGTQGSALKPTGSTRRWRRIRAWVLNRDGWRCQVLVDAQGNVVEAPRPTMPPAGPDDPAWLRAACPDHNLTRGKSLTDAPTNRRDPRPTRWSW